jgi:hypothetical protein
MNKKKNYVLRIDEATFDAIDKWASDEFRSINGQLEWIIYDAIIRAGRKPHQPKSESTKQPEK